MPPPIPPSADDRLTRLETLLRISRVGNSSPDPERTLRSLLREIVRITAATSGSIALLDPESGELEIVAAYKLPTRLWKRLKLPLGVGITGWVAYTGRPLREGNVLRSSHYVQIQPTIRSEMAAPLILDGRVIGVINVDSRQRDAFSAMDEELFVAVANQMARVIESARLHAAAGRHAQELESLFRFGQRLLEPLSLSELLREVAEEGRRLLRADLCLLALVEGGRPALHVRAFSAAEKELALPAAPPLALDTPPFSRLLRRPESLWIPDLLRPARSPLPEELAGLGLTSLQATPALFQGKVEGALVFFFRRPRLWEERESRLAQLLAGQFAVALANVRRTEHILAMEESLRRAERFSLLGGLAAEIAHDIRNPVTIITMLLHSMSESIAEPSNQRDLALVMEKLERINRIVDQTLDLARGGEAEFEPLDINELLADLLVFLRFKLDRAGLTLRKSFSGALPLIEADRGQLQQVFLNLLMNAIQAMEDGARSGALTVRTAPATLEDGRAAVAISVGDSGPGISEAGQKRLFEPFFTTRAGGTGLGLFISRKIVANHGGEIQARSTPGKGCVFTVRLPVAQPPEAAAAPPPAPEFSRATNILLSEGNSRLSPARGEGSAP